MTITLSTIGSRGVTIDVTPAALTGLGGCVITVGLHDGPLAISLTEDERYELVRMLEGAA